MIHRTRDAALHNILANRPSIRATFGIHLSDPAPLDFTENARRDDYILLTNGIDACSIMDMVSPACYDCHSLFGETCRGRDAVEQGKQFLQWMWDNSRAQILVGKTPLENRGARMFNRWIGFTSDGIRPFNSVEGSWDAEWFHILRP
jgi:hypothetical protein